MQHGHGPREPLSCRIRVTDEGRTRLSDLALRTNQQGTAIEQCGPVLFVRAKTASTARLRDRQFAKQLQQQREIGRPDGYRPSAPGPARRAAKREAGAQGTRRGKTDEDRLPGRGRTRAPLREAEDPAEPRVLGLEGTARTDRNHVQPRPAQQQQRAPADPHPGQPWAGRKSGESLISDRGPVRERPVREARGRVQSRVTGCEKTAVPALQQDLERAARQQGQALTGLHKGQSRGDRKPEESRPRDPGPAAKAATQEAKVRGMKGEARGSGRVPGPGQTRVPTQGARDRDA
jgi:hypothetical protein